VNDANIRESDFARWYNLTMADMAKKHSDAYEKMGEAVLFAELAAGQPNFKCSLMTGICQPVPGCKEIVNFIKSEAREPTSHWWGSLERDITTIELLDLARKTYFALLLYDGITRYYHTVDVGVRESSPA
jgi:hypothetical protein